MTFWSFDGSTSSIIAVSWLAHQTSSVGSASVDEAVVSNSTCQAFLICLNL